MPMVLEANLRHMSKDRVRDLLHEPYDVLQFQQTMLLRQTVRCVLLLVSVHAAD